jgi:hypothetical protein
MDQMRRIVDGLMRRKAGPRLDLDIAREVFNHPTRHNPKYGWHEYLNPADGIWEEIPAYSRILTNSKKVWDHLQKHGFDLDLMARPEEAGKPGYNWEIIQWKPLDETYGAEAREALGDKPVPWHIYQMDGGALTAELSICLAALAIARSDESPFRKRKRRPARSAKARTKASRR